MVISEYADALMVISKTLAVNAAKDASELIAKLRSAHAKRPRGRGSGHIEDQDPDICDRGSHNHFEN